MYNVVRHIESPAPPVGEDYLLLSPANTAPLALPCWLSLLNIEMTSTADGRNPAPPDDSPT